MMASMILLFFSLTCCVHGTVVVNVAHSSYQAEENQDLTLEWTFTPKPQSSLKDLFIICDFLTDQKDLVLFYLREGVEVPQKDGDFSGRVQWDKEVLREGRIRLNVSSLRTEDSGWYACNVKTDIGGNLRLCRVTVTAKNQNRSEREAESPDIVMWGWTDFLTQVGMIAGVAAVLFALCLYISRSFPGCGRGRVVVHVIDVISKERRYHGYMQQQFCHHDMTGRI
ncbi:uncharacterized protein LOC117807628 [Xyrichtys novacula]|uniref:Uncharacterized protein LOC117807628 n=1 Tax=Xyrichtys novacula TaxID=13765 RepID=A0AAV1HN74_XYRNO|nr:uncharacterized protein LOC117807628 [Xyrichtys novacula]